MNRQQEFQEQLKRTNQRVVKELLDNPEWRWLRSFYEIHFDEVQNLLDTRTVRTVIEDFWYIDPSLKQSFSSNILFVQQVNQAMKDGYLTWNML